MSRSTRSGGGYGRPPVEHQFKPGQSGNPRGRPKGRKNFTTIVVDALSRKVAVRDQNGPRTVSKLEAMIEVMINKAIAGNPHAFGKIVKIAENIKESTWQPPVSQSALLDSAYLSLQQGLDRIAKAEARKKELESTAKQQNNAPTQIKPGNK